MSAVVKIRPSWEHVDTDEQGNWYFELTDRPELDRKRLASEKVMREMENRRKL